MLPQILADNAAQQAANVACLPGIMKASLAMPDIHWGYGFPIGGVAAFDVETGVISPGGVGYDINCGVRLMATKLTHEQVESNENLPCCMMVVRDRYNRIRFASARIREPGKNQPQDKKTSPLTFVRSHLPSEN